MNLPLPPEREGSTRQRRAGEGRSRSVDNAYESLPTERSRELRNNATPAERKLWSAVSNRQLNGVRFNRQVVIRPYICDLVARSAKLIIEIDGGQHGASIGNDNARTSFLKSKGYRVIRFWNNDVLGNLKGVTETIEQALKDTPPARTGGKEERSDEGEGRSSSKNTSPPPLACGESTPPALAGGEK